MLVPKRVEVMVYPEVEIVGKVLRTAMVIVQECLERMLA